jgi:hypothetical protein
VSAEPAPSRAADVVAVAALDRAELDALLAAYGARLVTVAPHEAIPGSYWGDAEAGLIGNCVFVRHDTPAHSLLHELCHFVCMSEERRATLATDAGGDDAEEAGVCYLQVLLAERLSGFSAARCLVDMDAWGYSFREGSARAWFDGDGVFACEWLRTHGLIDPLLRPTLRVRSKA